MNKQIKKLAKDCGYQHIPITSVGKVGDFDYFDIERFSELLIEKVLDEVAERSYYSGDRAWSDDLDRQWVELEFGIGKLAELKNEPTN